MILLENTFLLLNPPPPQACQTSCCTPPLPLFYFSFFFMVVALAVRFFCFCIEEETLNCFAASNISFGMAHEGGGASVGSTEVTCVKLLVGGG